MAITISGDSVAVEYQVYDGVTVIVSGTSCTLNNCTFYGSTLTVSEDLTVNNCIFSGETITVATSKTLTINNCVASAAEPSVDGTITDTDVDWATDPIMKDPANDDFRLDAGSPCRSAGLDLSLAEDYLGVPIPATPDIGAFQTVDVVCASGVQAQVSDVAAVVQHQVLYAPEFIIQTQVSEVASLVPYQACFAQSHSQIQRSQNADIVQTKVSTITIYPVTTEIFDVEDMAERFDPDMHKPIKEYEFSSGSTFVKPEGREYG